ncbi:MAG: hypothetical protein AAFY11_14800, partial [Cyanobacteria bacterium J06641_5]
GSCSDQPFLLSVGPTEIRVSELVLKADEIRVGASGGFLELIVTDPNQIEPLLEEQLVVETGQDATLPLPELMPGTHYQIIASVICSTDAPSKNNTAIVDYNVPHN